MHQAKGLTADATIVLAAEDEYIPGRAAGGAIDDERRLLYVSLTRARHYLFMTHCRRRTGPQRHSGSTSGKEDRNLTRFLRGGPIESRDGREYVQHLTKA
jgi:DNA helicase-2/ATP-dependent DNA helicase PcrA